jgi:hypothetical protein
MNHVKRSFFKNAKKIPCGVKQVPAHIRLNGEALFSNLFAERAKSQNCVDVRRVALFPLQTARLRNERFGPANLHAVNNMRNLHIVILNLQRHNTNLSIVPGLERGNHFIRLS